MTGAETFSTCFNELYEETLPSLGMSDSQLIRIISARLLIERAGERDVNYWWDSRVLSDFGKDALQETVPRTATRSQMKLAMKVGRKVENEATEEESVSLFDLGPFVESRIQREIDTIEGGDELDSLTELSSEISETGWTESLVEDEITVESDVGSSNEVGSIAVEELQEKQVLEDVVSHLISGYGNASNQDLQVPYYSVKQ